MNGYYVCFPEGQSFHKRGDEGQTLCGKNCLHGVTFRGELEFVGEMTYCNNCSRIEQSRTEISQSDEPESPTTVEVA